MNLGVKTPPTAPSRDPPLSPLAKGGRKGGSVAGYRKLCGNPRLRLSTFYRYHSMYPCLGKAFRLTLLQVPRGTHRKIHETVRLFVADDLLLVGVPADSPPGSDRYVGQVDQRT